MEDLLEARRLSKALTRVKEKSATELKIHIYGQDPESLSEKEGDSDCQRPWSSALRGNFTE